MKVLQNRCIAQDWVICRYWKHQEIENKERDQYKEVVHTFNKELTSIIGKLKAESRLRKEAKKVKAVLSKELSTL